jgi:hypothetical protein
LIFQQFVLPLQIIMQQQKRTQNEKNTINNHRAFDDGAIVFGAKKGQKQKRSATSSCRAAGKAKQQHYDKLRDHNGHHQDRTLW